MVCGVRWPAQNGGDQILDGIGETSLIARFVLDGNAQDRSRDSHHATLHGSGGAFVDDKQFGRVLSLTGDDGVYLSLPAATLAEVESLSVVGWVNLSAAAPNQGLLSFERTIGGSFQSKSAAGDGKSAFVRFWQKRRCEFLLRSNRG